MSKKRHLIWRLLFPLTRAGNIRAFLVYALLSIALAVIVNPLRGEGSKDINLPIFGLIVLLIGAAFCYLMMILLMGSAEDEGKPLITPPPELQGNDAILRAMHEAAERRDEPSE